MWREGLGAYKIITEDKKGYRNHPAVKEFENAPATLWLRLYYVRLEMIKRGYNPKELPDNHEIHIRLHINGKEEYHPWQTLEEQITILKSKGCECKI